jgi:hypothetical protein
MLHSYGSNINTVVVLVVYEIGKTVNFLVQGLVKCYIYHQFSKGQFQ